MAYSDLIRVSTPYRPSPGWFSRAIVEEDGTVRSGVWYYCRERWHQEVGRSKFFFYSHAQEHGEAVAAFIHRAEATLGVPPSLIGPTQRKTISWVRPNKWWLSLALRWSFYTVLLRCSLAYTLSPDNFRDALYSVDYTVNTEYAVERFLAGYTKCTGRKRGWCSQFNGAGADVVDRLLVLP